MKKCLLRCGALFSPFPDAVPCISYAAYFFSLRKKAAAFFKMPVNFYQTRRRYIPEDNVVRTFHVIKTSRHQHSTTRFIATGGGVEFHCLFWLYSILIFMSFLSIFPIISLLFLEYFISLRARTQAAEMDASPASWDDFFQEYYTLTFRHHASYI